MSGQEKEKPCCKNKTPSMVRPSELPMYGNPHPPKDMIHLENPGTIESSIRTAREATVPYYSIVASATGRGMQVISTALSHSRSLYDKISDEGSAIPKAAAITAGGLTGLLFASRKGFIRKILYTGFGLTAAAAACYPEQSKELMDLSAYIARRRGPDLIKELIGVDVSPYLDPKKLNSAADTPGTSESSSSSSTSSPSTETPSSKK